jgi:hypothetical protein
VTHPFWTQHHALKKQHVVLYKPYLAQVTGSAAAAVLLSHICFWFQPKSDGTPKLSITRDQKLWFVKHRSDLMEECGLTEWELRAARALLVEKKIIQAEVHRWKGLTSIFIHLNVDRLAELAAPVLCNPQDRNGCFLKTGMDVSSSECISEAYSTAKTTAVLACEDPHAKTPTFDHLSKSLQEEDQGSAKVIQMPTAKDILEKIKTAKQENKITGGKQGVHWLAMRWKQKLALLSDEFVKGLTQQEVGQLKAFMVAVGGVQIAKEIIDFILPMWGEFAFEAKASYGLSTAPDKPVVGFLLKYHDVAVQLSAKSKQVLVHHIPTQPVAKPPHPPQLDQPEETVTKDAVLAALAKLKGG